MGCDCGEVWVPGPGLTGHAPSCPVHREILGPHGSAGPGAEREDRGTPLWVWVHGGRTRFEPFPEAVRVVEVSVPIGWRLLPDVGSGVALTNVAGDRLTADQVWGLAASVAKGFRVRWTRDIPAE